MKAKPLYGKRRRLVLSFSNDTTEDLDYGFFYAYNRLRVCAAYVGFARLPEFSSGITVAIESDTGSAETIICEYDTVSGTAAGTPYALTFAAVNPVIENGRWAQLHVNNLEGTTATGTVIVEVEDIPG